MKNLNQSWLILIIAGVAFLVFYFIWTFAENLSGANVEFVHTPAPFISKTIISTQLQEHLQSTSTIEQQN